MNTLSLLEFSLTRYVCLALLVFGTFGNMLNMFVFTRRKLRSISCSWYFLASTSSSVIALYSGCLTRVLATFDVNPRTTLQSAMYCKTRSFFTYGNLSLSVWFVTGACIDRWALSCTDVRIRSISSVPMAKRIILATFLTVYVAYAQMFFCFDGAYESNSSNCFTKSETCELYNSFALFFTYSVVPCFLMLTFGLMTIRNRLYTQRKTVPAQIVSSHRHKLKFSTPMTVMLLAQVVCSIIFSLPLSVQNIYNELTRNSKKSPQQQSLENFLGILFILITLMNSSISFYIFAFTGKMFRGELKELLSFSRKFLGVPLSS